MYGTLAPIVSSSYDEKDPYFSSHPIISYGVGWKTYKENGDPELWATVISEGCHVSQKAEVLEFKHSDGSGIILSERASK
jgi:hypothetical protein